MNFASIGMFMIYRTALKHVEVITRTLRSVTELDKNENAHNGSLIVLI